MHRLWDLELIYISLSLYIYVYIYIYMCAPRALLTIARSIPYIIHDMRLLHKVATTTHLCVDPSTTSSEM